MEFNPRSIEQKWNEYWEKNDTYKVTNGGDKPKFYVLDMFPYPSGAGLHVGHPLGYIASDIFSRYKKLKGFNVLHPMGFDSFGLPAEQYAIQTGQHPAITTETNITTYIKQLKKIGFSYDWSREVRTSEPNYYKWTQWIFMQLFNHYYDKNENKALSISDLEIIFSKEGNKNVQAVCDEDTPIFTAAEWNEMSEEAQQMLLLKYRLTYPNESMVNFCPALGMVLANDEIKDGVSERGGYPVIQKRMKQWSMRITAYADRLIDGLNEVDWSDSLKEQQRNWIGRSQGASVKFFVLNPSKGGTSNVEASVVQSLDPEEDLLNKQNINLTSNQKVPSSGRDLGKALIEVFTTRVDTIYGVSFMVLAPEHELVANLTTAAQKDEVEAYQKWAASRSEVDRMSEAKTVSGAFTGSYAINPFNEEKIPIYIADYVLANYGTGAVMGVPSGDQRDWNFATHFGLPIIPILDAQKDIDQQADATKEGKYINSGIINGMEYKEATATLITWLEERGLGKGKIQYRLRNAVFSRQRYWGEPVPAFFKGDVPYLIQENELPLVLPEVDKYLPTETGEPPLGRAKDFKYQNLYDYELSTMPGWAGSSWYWYRYMDAQNNNEFASKEAIEYWKAVDLYVGGTEHATGHLLYSRFWNHFLYDLGKVPEREYAKKLINQGMIQGRSLYLKLKTGRSLFVNVTLADEKDRLFKNVYDEMVLSDNRFEGINATEDIDWQTDEKGQLYAPLKPVIEKMSKRTLNVVNPDDMVDKYGADCFRMYEMFLGPIEQAKPWDTNGISGVAGFLRKLWSLFHDVEKGKIIVSDDEPAKEELKALHQCIKDVTGDIERFSLNTCVSNFMKCVNELKKLNCSKRLILSDLAVLIAPFAPYTAEELWTVLGNTPSVHHQSYPMANEVYLISDTVAYPIAVNGKTRDVVDFAADTTQTDIEAYVLSNEKILKHLEGKTPKKIIFVKGKMVNVVI